MTKKTAVELFQQGHPLLVVEYRSGSAEAVKYRDKETGRDAGFDLATHNVEAGNLTLQVSDFLPDGAKITDWVQPFKKGTLCVLRLKSLRTEKGVHKASGVLESLTD